MIFPWWWRWAAVGLIILASAAFGAAKMHRWDEKRYDALDAEYKDFKDKVVREGAAAEAHAKAEKARFDKIKESVDRENLRLRSDNALLSKRLLDARSGQGYLPAPSPGAPNTNRITFDRDELESAIRRLDEGVSRVIEQGDAFRINLDTAILWAKDRGN